MSDGDFTVPYGYCHCGCGEKTPVPQRTYARLGRVKGEPTAYLPYHRLRVERVKRAEEYRQEWKEERPEIPYGYCWCGCGQQTGIARYTSDSEGKVHGEPVRRLVGHNVKNAHAESVAVQKYKACWKDQQPHITYGFCWCGCGQQTQIAKISNTSLGHVRGEPVRYLPGHRPQAMLGNNQHKYRVWWEENTSVPYGYCWCGCGEQTNRAQRTIQSHGYVQGEPVRYIAGHYSSVRHGLTLAQYKERWEREAPDIPYGFCQCGCGKRTTICGHTSKRRGLVKGEPTRLIRGHKHPGGLLQKYAQAPKATESNYVKEHVRQRSRIRKRLRDGRRRARESNGGLISVADLLKMYEDQGGLCAYCECELGDSYNVEHMVPLCRGGANSIENIAIACPSCNVRKSTKTAEEFMMLL